MDRSKIGIDRKQIQFTCYDEMVGENAVCRIIDAFVERFAADLGLAGDYSDCGRLPYSKSDLMKLYIWGYYNKVCSSRKLMRECLVNVEAMWIMSGLHPDFRTISDFRKDYKDSMEKAFVIFVDFCRESFPGSIGAGYFSVDGTKMRASNAKDKCFTASKIDDRLELIKQKKAQFNDYLRQIEQNDEAEKAEEKPSANIKGFTKEEIEEKLANYDERESRYKGYLEKIAETGEQISETDVDSRLMKHHNGNCLPSFNIQTAVDSESHMIAAFQATNRCTDHNLLFSTLGPLKKEDSIMESVADNGYMSNDDLVECLENGILPNVCGSTFRDESGAKTQNNEYDLEFDYEANTITDEEKASTDPEKLKRCLRAGVIPDCYEGYFEKSEGDLNIITRHIKEHVDDDLDKKIDALDEDGKIALAKEGYFVRDIAADKVYCPCGRILRKKSIKKDGSTRYCNKLACKECTKRCFLNESLTTRWKEVDFKEGIRIKSADSSKRNKGKFKKVGEMKKIVLRFKPDLKKLDTRKCLSEHPFGTMKFWRGKDTFLLRGLEKIKAEFALMATSYDLTRAIKLYSFEKVMEQLRLIG